MFTLDRANMWKRISAWLLDKILLVIIATGFAFLISWITKYDSYSDNYYAKYEEYQETYGLDFSDIEVQTYMAKYKSSDECTAEEVADKEKCHTAVEAYKAFSNDEDVLYNWNMRVNLTLIMVTTSTLLAIMLCEFFVPLFLKNGQTVGKLCFNICLVKNNCVRVNNLMIFTRALLGKFAIESIIPIYAVVLMLFFNGGRIWIIITGLILVINFVLVFFTRNHTPIHDLLAGTIVVDKSSQMIYQNDEELIRAKEEEAKKEAIQSIY